MALVYNTGYNLSTLIGDREIKFKEWTAKEEKKYLSTMEDEKIKISDKLIFDILIKPCIEDKDIVLSVSEQKLLLIEIRKASISEKFNDIITCKECDENTEVDIKIDDICLYEKSKYSLITINYNDDIFKFEIDDIKTNKMKEKLVLDDGLVNYIFTDFLLHIKSIEINGDINDTFTYKELERFMDSVPTKVFDEVFEKYQEMIDLLELEYKFVCPHCGTKETIDYTNIPGFLWI